jgi:hypothetical protein
MEMPDLKINLHQARLRLQSPSLWGSRESPQGDFVSVGAAFSRAPTEI